MAFVTPVDVDEPVMFAAIEDDVALPVDNLGSIDGRAARAADELGLSAASIERLPFDLSALDAGGVFINVDAANFGLLDRRLDWQALGITLPRGADLAFRPPRCGLVPDRYRLPLLRPAAQAHTALHRYSYHFRLVETLFETPAYRWLPWKAWPEFERAFASACAQLAEALDVYEANFGGIRETVLVAFSQLAADSTRRLEATGHPVSNDFADFVLRGVMTALPAPETLREKLSLRYRVGV